MLQAEWPGDRETSNFPSWAEAWRARLTRWVRRDPADRQTTGRSAAVRSRARPPPPSARPAGDSREFAPRLCRSGAARRDFAYAIYTSGTTGQPKGVLVEHRPILRLVHNTNYLTLRPGDCILMTGALSFDASTFEIWGALLNGAALCRPIGHADAGSRGDEGVDPAAPRDHRDVSHDGPVQPTGGRGCERCSRDCARC